MRVSCLLLIPPVFLDTEYVFVGEFHNSVEVIRSSVEELMDTTHVPSGDLFDVSLVILHLSWCVPGDVNCEKRDCCLRALFSWKFLV